MKWGVVLKTSYQCVSKRYNGRFCFFPIDSSFLSVYFHQFPLIHLFHWPLTWWTMIISPHCESQKFMSLSLQGQKKSWLRICFWTQRADLELEHWTSKNMSWVCRSKFHSKYLALSWIPSTFFLMIKYPWWSIKKCILGQLIADRKERIKIKNIYMY